MEASVKPDPVELADMTTLGTGMFKLTPFVALIGG